MDDSGERPAGHITPRHLERMTRSYLDAFVMGQSLDPVEVAEMLERIAADYRSQGEAQAALLEKMTGPPEMRFCGYCGAVGEVQPDGYVDCPVCGRRFKADPPAGA
jgi:hypothetical protein